ncbi:hypothetical protein [Clostridium sp. DJ247]|uniref:hypothetical protein n=1 Tax=Clostridium sp. DJ247 TaxID=2726188 RepID=UPI001625A75B|nr:hypothetical protein [Clostridium sp. DJ247]MBC2580443.1 hypothetical protein [Clostridium sp. DJ247]
MKNKDKFLSKYIKAYNEFKKKQIAALDKKKINIESKLKEEIIKFNKLSEMKETLKKENDRYDATYSSLIKILKSRGILFTIPNNNFNIKEWDNLFIKNINGLYVLVNKNEDLLYAINEEYSDVVKYIINNYSYSVVVIRKDAHLIKIQLRVL